MSESLNLKLPYTSGEGVTLALLTLNELNTAYALNKSFARLLANDMFLSMYGTLDIGINTINPYISFNEYRPNSRIIVNPTTKYSNNPTDKFKILAALKYISNTPPEELNTALYNQYDKVEKDPAQYDYIVDTYAPSYSDFTEDYNKNYLKSVKLSDKPITQLNTAIKTGSINYSTHDTTEELDYVVKTGIIQTPYTIYASTTEWGDGVKLNPNWTVNTTCYSWYRLYKSGYIECGGISRPFSLTEQWNGNFAKGLVKIGFPKPMKCLNANYTFVGIDNNFITQYNPRYTTESLVMYQITEGRQSPKNYVYSSVKETPNANPGNYIQSITEDGLTIQINNESYDLDNSGLGATDAVVVKISWQASGIAV